MIPNLKLCNDNRKKDQRVYAIKRGYMQESIHSSFNLETESYREILCKIQNVTWIYISLHLCWVIKG